MLERSRVLYLCLPDSLSSLLRRFSLFNFSFLVWFDAACGRKVVRLVYVRYVMASGYVQSTDLFQYRAVFASILRVSSPYTIRYTAIIICAYLCATKNNSARAPLVLISALGALHLRRCEEEPVVMMRFTAGPINRCEMCESFCACADCCGGDCICCAFDALDHMRNVCASV